MYSKNKAIKFVKIIIALTFLGYLIVYVIIPSDVLKIKGEHSYARSPQIKTDRDQMPQPAYAAQEYNITWGGTDEEYAAGVTVDGTGNVYIVGSTSSFGSVKDAFLVKYASNGTQLWNRTYGAVADWDQGSGVTVYGGNVYITGKTDSTDDSGDIFLAKYTSDGTQLWNRTWGGALPEDCRNVAVDESGNIYVTGSTYSYGAGGGPDAFLLKYTSDGTRLWNVTWGYFSGGGDYGYDVTLDSTGNIYVAGVAYSDFAMIVKYNPDSTQLWNRTWGSASYALGVERTLSDNVYLTGYTKILINSVLYSYTFLAKYAPDGTLQWNKTDLVGEAYNLAADGSGNAYITGQSRYGAGGTDVILAKYNLSGTLLWNLTWGGANNDIGYDVAVDNSGNSYFSGSTASLGAGGNDAFLTKYTMMIRTPVR